VRRPDLIGLRPTGDLQPVAPRHHAARGKWFDLALVLGPPELLSGSRHLLVKLLLDEHHNHAPRVLISDLLKSPDETQHLQIFDALGHGRDLIGKSRAETSKLCGRYSRKGIWNLVEG
jgi:hypothetical protein